MTDINNQISQHNLLTEDWGGSIVTVNISAKTKEGIPELIQHIGNLLSEK